MSNELPPFSQEETNRMSNSQQDDRNTSGTKARGNDRKAGPSTQEGAKSKSTSRGNAKQGNAKQGEDLSLIHI